MDGEPLGTNSNTKIYLSTCLAQSIDNNTNSIVGCSSYNHEENKDNNHDVTCSNNEENQIKEEKDKYSIISFLTKKNVKCKKTIELIKEIGDSLIIVGTDNKIYNHKANNDNNILNFGDWILNFEKAQNDNIIICTKDKIYEINLNFKPNSKKELLNELKEKEIIFIFQIEKDNYVLCLKDKILLINHIFGKYKEENNKTLREEEYYKVGISLNNEKFALASNHVINKGKDKLIIYNINNLNIQKELNGSFILSSTGLKIMLYNNKDKILLCACKKYTKGQKNGILLFYNFESENNNNEINEQFYDTKFFEVHCFCQILEESNNNKVLPTDEELKFTNNFFVGGLDTVKKRGIIKLYEIKQKKKDNKEIFEIEIIQNIEFKKKGSFKGFQRAISCIEQSKSGNVYITSWDGYVYEFSSPNLNLYNSNIII